MMAVKRITLVTKPEQLPKLDPGPVHILLGANLRIKDKNEGNKKWKKMNILNTAKK